MHGRLKPNRSASAGATGNIYEMSFEYERLKKTGDDDRNEIIKGAGTVLLRRQITSEMLDDKEKLEESGIAGLNQHKPRRCNGAKDQHAAHKIKPPPERPVARDQRIERERCTWQQHANQPLGEHSQRHGSPA